MTDVPEVFALVVELGLALGAHPLTRHAGPWECDVGGGYRVAVNGHPEPRPTAGGFVLRPYTVYVEFEGWPFAVVDANGGAVVGADWAALAAALRDAIARAKVVRE